MLLLTAILSSEGEVSGTRYVLKDTEDRGIYKISSTVEPLILLVEVSGIARWSIRWTRENKEKA